MRLRQIVSVVVASVLSASRIFSQEVSVGLDGPETTATDDNIKLDILKFLADGSSGGGDKISLVEQYLNSGGDPDESDPRSGFTPLIHAANSKDFELVKYLVSNRANVNLAERDGFTPLMYAVHHGHLEITDFLIAHGADVDAVARNGEPSVWSLAGQSGFKDTLTELVERLRGQGQEENTELEQEPKSNLNKVELAHDVGSSQDQSNKNGKAETAANLVDDRKHVAIASIRNSARNSGFIAQNAHSEDIDPKEATTTTDKLTDEPKRHDDDMLWLTACLLFFFVFSVFIIKS